jgi:hypothetical protein
MTTKQRQIAKRAKAKSWAQRRVAELKDTLFNLLGRECVACHECRCARLEFDHIFGRTWQPREMGSVKRMEKYLAEAQKGLIQILCRHCNASDGENKKKLYRAKGGRKKALRGKI